MNVWYFLPGIQCAWHLFLRIATTELRVPRCKVPLATIRDWWHEYWRPDRFLFRASFLSNTSLFKVVQYHALYRSVGITLCEDYILSTEQRRLNAVKSSMKGWDHYGYEPVTHWTCHIKLHYLGSCKFDLYYWTSYGGHGLFCMGIKIRLSKIRKPTWNFDYIVGTSRGSRLHPSYRVSLGIGMLLTMGWVVRLHPVPTEQHLLTVLKSFDPDRLAAYTRWPPPEARPYNI